MDSNSLYHHIVLIGKRSSSYYSDPHVMCFTTSQPLSDVHDLRSRLIELADRVTGRDVTVTAYVIDQPSLERCQATFDAWNMDWDLSALGATDVRNYGDRSRYFPIHANQ